MTRIPRLLGRARGLAGRMRATLAPREPHGSSKAATIDLAAPATARDPFPHYEALRAGGPVQFLPRHDFWIVLGHNEVGSAFSRPTLFSNRPYAEVDAVLLA